MTIKAIKTEYKGYRFRSRLEARWAVYFDTLEIVWEYEKEGYWLSDGARYLPDFWIPNTGVFIEVKADYPTGDEIKKCLSLCSGTRKTCWIVDGAPCVGFEKQYVMISSGGGQECVTDDDVYLSHEPLTPADLDRGRYGVFPWGEIEKHRPKNGEGISSFVEWQEKNLKILMRERASHRISMHSSAVHASRAARFEHGEKGYRR